MLDNMVLLVEDDPADARLIQRAFTKMGVKAHLQRLTNGDDVIAYLSGERPYENRAAYPLPKIILLDIKLPRRSGFEVLQWLRSRSDALRRLPVVMLTSSSHAVDVNRAYDLGANSYLTKPDTSGDLEHLAHLFNTYWLGANQQPNVEGGTLQYVGH